MINKSSRNRLEMSRYKLDSLLDITMSINANLSIEELLYKYESILRQNLNIDKVLIFLKDDNKWDCLLNAGFPDELTKNIDPETQLIEIEETTLFSVSDEFSIPGIDIIFPVFNNNDPLAYVLIGDLEEESEGMSPILKHLHFMQTISNIIIVAIENIKLFDESLRQEALKKELELAARMQSMLIPHNDSLPANENIFVTGFYHPHYEIGGDYYDCIQLSDNLTGFCIADVSGKGISAALLMSNFQAAFRAMFTAEIDLITLINKLNSIVVTNASGEKFITFFVARYNHTTRELEYINAAHNPPVLYDLLRGTTKLLEAKCVGIGMLDKIPFINIDKIHITNPSKIVCYTDGLSEIRDNDGNDIGTAPIERHISNTDNVDINVKSLIKELGLPDDNPHLFDDVSILALKLF